ncbi:MAG: rRNA pseudouridine synthase [Rickettsiales bacterium]|jgi:23S rRNA pseudouridine2605 synthase|nr:rRNA pseudouridine synthase [Rickettsiales bacterium]
MRIAKAIADSGLCSRRDAEKMIAEGRVRVNGAPIATPALNTAPTDKIEVDSKPIAHPDKPRLFAYHKPAGLVVSHRDEQGRDTVFNALPKEYGRLLSVGRLDLNSEGLLLLTNSGELQRALEKGDFERVYKVRVRGLARQSVFDKLARGITVDGIKYRPITVEVEKAGATNSWFKVVLREGKNREIRKVFSALGYDVNRLIRTSYAGMELGDLKAGEVKEIPCAALEKMLSLKSQPKEKTMTMNKNRTGGGK